MSAQNQAVTNVDRTTRSVKGHTGSDWATRRSTARSTPQEISVLLAASSDADFAHLIDFGIADAGR